MKRIIKSIFCILGILLISCENEKEFDFQDKMKVTSCKTRGLNSWDTCTKGLLRSGKLVNLPWSSSTQTTIPQEVRTDIKEQDGWKILYSTIDIDGYN